jgi:hypothetical protein
MSAEWKEKGKRGTTEDTESTEKLREGARNRALLCMERGISAEPHPPDPLSQDRAGEGEKSKGK